MISMKNVCFDYGNGTRALHNINLNIEHMNGNEQDVDKLIKMISDRINMTKKRW